MQAVLLGAWLVACGPAETECPEPCTAPAELTQALPPDGCYPYCEEEPPPERTPWKGTVTATPVLINRDPSATQPQPATYYSEFLVSGSITGLCESPVPLSDGRFRGSMTCVSNVVVPAFLASDSPDTWYQCDGASVTIYSLDLYYRDGGATLYVEGGAAISGCSRTWDMVLFQTTAKR